jgi:hypothetical protein
MAQPGSLTSHNTPKALADAMPSICVVLRFTKAFSPALYHSILFTVMVNTINSQLEKLRLKGLTKTTSEMAGESKHEPSSFHRKINAVSTNPGDPTRKSLLQSSATPSGKLNVFASKPRSWASTTQAVVTML